MYQAHFGVIGDPFANVPDTQRFFNGAKRGAVLDALAYAIQRGEAIVKVVGEVGTGKTMLCRMLADTLPENTEVIYLANPSLSPDTILHAIAAELHLPNVTPVTTKFEVLQALQSYLLARHAHNRHVVMLVEEAQCMPLATLEEIRLLSNLETHRHKLLQIVLFGQPELDEKLAAPSMRQLRERISHGFYLEPFDLEEVNDYLNFKLCAAGDCAPGLFSKGAGRAIYRHSRGLVRRVNFLADKTLLAAFSENALSVEPRHVRRAAQDCEFTRGGKWSAKYFFAGCALAVGVMAVAQWANTRSSGIESLAGPIAASEEGKAPAEQVAAVHAEEQSLEAFEATLQAASKAMVDTASSPRESEIQKANSDALQDGRTLARLNATRAWAAGIEPKRYTVQILTTFTERANEIRGLERLVENDAVQPVLGELYLHDGTMDQKPVLVLSYGGFDSFEAARTAVARLPRELTRYQPLVRTVESLRAEINTEVN